MARIVWCEVTRNCHVGRLDDVPVVTVERPQKHRPDGTKHDWRIVVFGDPYAWNKLFLQYDPRDLDSTKSAAEARTKYAIERLYRSLHVRVARRAESAHGLSSVEAINEGLRQQRSRGGR